MGKVTALRRWVKQTDACEVLANADTDRASGKWLAARKTVITAGEVPIVLGIWGSATRLWYEKVGMIERHDLDDAEYAQMGHDLEDVNAQLFQRQTGRALERAQLFLRSRSYPWLGCTLDYVQWLGDKPGGAIGPLELKSTGRKENWPDDDEPHLKYQAQLQTQMLVMGSGFGSLSAIIGSPYFHHRRADYERHAAFCQTILDRTYAFWQSVQAGVEPPIVDDTEEANWAMRHLALDVLGDSAVMLPDAALEWTEEWEKAKKAIVAWQGKKRYYENLLMAKIGTAEKGILPYNQGTLTLKLQKRKAYTVSDTATRVLRRAE